MRYILDAIFKYLAWALFLLIAVMFEVTWGYADAVSQSYHTQQTIKLAVILLCGIIIIDIVFALIGVYRRSSRKMLVRRVEKKTENRIRAEQAAEAQAALAKGNGRRSLFFRRKQQLPPQADAAPERPTEYEAPIIVFPPTEEEKEEQDIPGEDLSLRGRLRSALAVWVSDRDNGGDDESGTEDE